ncbi:MAG TPA: late competence development ComFB family protein [Candidatus Obscuribacterales bacterium]
MGGESRTAHQKLYVNVMEMLVAEEVDRQLNSLPDRVSKYIKRTEVETFALNRLPALYASSEKGLRHQYDRALHEYRQQILSAVRQAFAAVQVDPIRLSQPLKLNEEEEAVLQALRDLLKEPELTWKSALKEIQRLQHRRPAPGAGAPPPTNKRMPEPPPRREAEAHDAHHSTAWRPGTYGSRVSWKPNRLSHNPEGGFEDNAH